MEPLVDEHRPPEQLRVSRRKLMLAGAAVVVVALAVAVAVVLVSRDQPGVDEVAGQLRTAIAESAPPKAADGTAGRFDTTALRARLDGVLEGWYVDLAADNGATRVGAAARELEGGSCVFAWSDVGGPLSAVVTDPALPCVADIALIASKAPS